MVDITPEDISYVIEQLLKQYTKWNIIERAAQTKDRVVIDYYPIFDGKEETENKAKTSP